MSAKRTKLAKSVDQYGELELGQTLAGWPGAKFKSKETKVNVRRVVNDDHSDHVQVHITITECFESGRSRQTLGSLVIPAADIPQLVEHLTKNRREFAKREVA